MGRGGSEEGRGLLLGRGEGARSLRRNSSVKKASPTTAKSSEQAEPHDEI